MGDKSTSVVGTTNLTIVLGDKKHKRELCAKFIVVNISFSYNAILGRPILSDYGIIINMGMLCLKLPVVVNGC